MGLMNPCNRICRGVSRVVRLAVLWCCALHLLSVAMVMCSAKSSNYWVVVGEEGVIIMTCAGAAHTYH